MNHRSRKLEPVRNGMPRRDFLRFSVAASGGLLIGFYLPGISDTASAQVPANEFMPNAFVRIGTDERVTVIVNHSEMGQGVYTSLPMLLAEELDADWSKVGFESAPVDPKYNHPVFGMQMTGGSSSVWSGMEQFRQAGAAARALLIAAAAQRWSIEPIYCRTESGAVFDNSDGKLTYGQLVADAAKLSPPAKVQLKDPKNFKLIGKPIKRLDTGMKSNGSAVFGLDVKLPGMLTAVVARAPIFGAKVKSFDDSKARSLPGVRKIAQVPSGVAVVADTFWQAKVARDALRVEWDEGAMHNFSTTQLMQQFRERAKSPGVSVRKEGDAPAALAGAAKTIQAVYEAPYLSHLMMEPLNCVVDLRSDSCEVWTGSQFQTIDRANAAKTAGLPNEKVQLHTTFLGGGFGRRANPQSDFVVEAVAVAKAVGAPAKVKVVWTREDDMQGGWYRPAFLHAIEGGIDASGNAVSWRSRSVGQSIMAGTPFEGDDDEGKGTIRHRSRAWTIFPTPFLTSPSSRTRLMSMCRCSGCVPSAILTLHSLRNASWMNWRRWRKKIPTSSGASYCKNSLDTWECSTSQRRNQDGASPFPRAWAGESPCTLPSAVTWPTWPKYRSLTERSECIAWCARWTAVNT